MPELKIKSWTWEKVTTERQVNDADSPVLVSHRIDHAETVRAVFAVIDPEPFARTRNSKKQVLPEVLLVELTSTNGQPWSVGWKSKIVATNILQGGGVGARVDIDRVWFPEWAKAATFDNGSPVSEWINVEYPR
jgi:hypothetical protein